MTEDRAKVALEAARQFASERKFSAALRKHIWYHNHALEINPAQYGVRLSFALGDWMELARNYPPALAALKKIRDQKTRKLLNATKDRELFHDVQSINRRLNDTTATVE